MEEREYKKETLRTPIPNESFNQASQKLQWHPAFVAGIQIEFADESDYLTFEPEHQLGTKPMAIDVLIKKDRVHKMQKNIGRIFRTYNIIEYKSPEDYLNIDDFYKVYGYTCFYKSDVPNVNAIPIEELTITMISKSFPKKLINHFKTVRGYQICKIEEGIYYILGDQIPIQLIVTSRLNPKENLWLKSLTNKLSTSAEAAYLIQEYEKHKSNKLYKSVMDIIVRANTKQFEEVKNMCDALEELMKDELNAKEMKGKIDGRKETLRTIIPNLFSMNMSIDDIAKATGESIDVVQQILDETSK